MIFIFLPRGKSLRWHHGEHRRGASAHTIREKASWAERVEAANAVGNQAIGNVRKSKTFFLLFLRTTSINNLDSPLSKGKRGKGGKKKKERALKLKEKILRDN